MNGTHETIETTEATQTPGANDITARRVIVVGVDGTDGSRLALRWALQEAASGDQVHAVATWHWEGYDESALETSGPQAARDVSQTRLDDQVESVLAEWTATPAPSVTREILEGSPADALVAASAGADLLVLGSHGHSKLRHRLMGSVSSHIIENATCPVVFVPLPRA